MKCFVVWDSHRTEDLTPSIIFRGKKYFQSLHFSKVGSFSIFGEVLFEILWKFTVLLWVLHVGFVINACLILCICCLFIKPLEEKDVYTVRDSLPCLYLNLYLEMEGKGWKINLWTFSLRKYCREIISLQSIAHGEKQLREIFTAKGILNPVKQEAMKPS